MRWMCSGSSVCSLGTSGLGVPKLRLRDWGSEGSALPMRDQTEGAESAGRVPGRVLRGAAAGRGGLAALARMCTAMPRAPGFGVCVRDRERETETERETDVYTYMYIHICIYIYMYIYI